jgi:hypothetical protein
MPPGGITRDGRRVNTDIDADEVKKQLEELAGTIEAVTADMKDARARNDIQTEYSLSGTLNNLYGSQKYLQGQLRAGERARERAKDIADRSDPVKQFESYIGAHFATQIAQSLVTAGDTVVGSQKTLAGGDYAGATVQREKGLGQLFGEAAGTLAGAILGSFIMPGIGTIAGAGIAGAIGNFLGGLPGDFSERDLAFSQNYKNALPAMESFYQRFGTNINIKTGEENSRAALDWYNRASEMSYGTGKTTEELMQAAQNRAAYGNFSGEEALSGARQDIMRERFTGANLANIQRVSGLAMRYGGDTGAIQTAFAGLQASGMGKGQFDEFLTPMQRIMEDGIEKGFVRGADEIAGNMAMLSKLSGGNALWTGEQGAKRLGQMNESMYNATDLRTIEDTLSFAAAGRLLGEDNPETSADERELNFYRLNGGLSTATLKTNANFRSSASYGNNIMGQIPKEEIVDILGMEGEFAKVINSAGKEGYIHETLLDIQKGKGRNTPLYTGTYVDNMITLERGLQPELLREQMLAVKEIEGEGNRAGQIERYRSMFGLNYTGANKIWEMSQNEDFLANPEKFKSKIEGVRQNADYLSDSQLFRNAMTKLTTEGVNIGKITFDKVEMEYLEEATEEMRNIYKELKRKNDNPSSLPSIERIMDTATSILQENFAYDPTRSFNFKQGFSDIMKYKNKTNSDYGEKIAGRFMSAIGDIDEDENIDRDTILAMEEFVKKFYNSTGPFSNGINESENKNLEPILNRLIILIDRLEKNKGKDVSFMLPSVINVYEMS